MYRRNQFSTFPFLIKQINHKIILVLFSCSYSFNLLFFSLLSCSHYFLVPCRFLNGYSSFTKKLEIERIPKETFSYFAFDITFSRIMFKFCVVFFLLVVCCLYIFFTSTKSKNTKPKKNKS